MRENCVDIACITETWLKETIPCQHINIPGYKIFTAATGRTGDEVVVLPCLCNTVCRASHCQHWRMRMLKQSGCYTGDHKCLAPYHVLLWVLFTTHQPGMNQ